MRTMEHIRVIHHRDDDTWVAESPDVENWIAVGATYDEVRRLAEEGVRFALDRDDVTVEHFVPEGAPQAA